MKRAVDSEVREVRAKLYVDLGSTGRKAAMGSEQEGQDIELRP